MNIHKILPIAATILAGIFCIFWIYHIVECLRRKDFRIGDKIFWFIILLAPVLGLILYRGIGNEFYNNKTRDGKDIAVKEPARPVRKRRIPRGGAKIELPTDLNPPAGKK